MPHPPTWAHGRAQVQQPRGCSHSALLQGSLQLPPPSAWRPRGADSHASYTNNDGRASSLPQSPSARRQMARPRLAQRCMPGSDHVKPDQLASHSCVGRRDGGAAGRTGLGLVVGRLPPKPPGLILLVLGRLRGQEPFSRSADSGPGVTGRAAGFNVIVTELPSPFRSRHVGDTLPSGW